MASAWASARLGLGSAYRAHPHTFGEAEGVTADERTAGGVLPYCSNHRVLIARSGGDPLARLAGRDRCRIVLAARARRAAYFIDTLITDKMSSFQLKEVNRGSRPESRRSG